MSYTIKESPETVHCLVDTLTIEGATLNETNLSTLSSSDLEQLAELSQNLNMSSDMEVQVVPASSEEEEVHAVHEEQVEEEYVQDELGAQEIEIETETAQIVEEIVPETKNVKTAVPPLRPLTIAPKPAKAVPIQLKPAAGPQLLLLQGGTVGQQIKLVSQTGQELNLSNVIGKPMTIKPTVKTISAQGNLSVIQPKQVLMKKLSTQMPKTNTSKTTVDNKQHVIVMQKADTPQVKIVQSSQSGVVSGTTKTITLAQAQQMGYFGGAKFVPHITPGKQTIMLNKTTPPNRVKVVPQVLQIKSPTKILPAPQTNVQAKTGTAQRIILKSTNPVIAGSQLIQVSGASTLSSAGQVHQINIPGKGLQYIRFLPAPDSNTSATVANAAVVKTPTPAITNKVIPVSISTPGKVSNTSEVKKVSKANLLAPKPTKTSENASSTQVLMVPATYVQSTSATSSGKLPIPVIRNTTTKPPASENAPIVDGNLDANGIRPRKPCNCTKSQCLKLYCDCFANGEFCHMCNCMNCYNNLENEEHRQRAIKNCLERNPNAFRPKIGKSKDTSGDSAIRKHTKGCNCKRSGCLKNYCECYEAKIACSNNCKCIGCRNIEETAEKKSAKQMLHSELGLSPQTASLRGNNDNQANIRTRKALYTKQAFNFITSPVIEATTQCLLALCNEDVIEDEEAKMCQIIQEFGLCLEAIIDCSMNNSIGRDV